MPQKKVVKNFEVWEEHWESVMLFLKMMTQWRTTMSGVIGLDYSVLQMLFQMYDVRNKKQIFEDIQIMERAAMNILNKEQK